jgi:hypothetical protein
MKFDYFKFPLSPPSTLFGNSILKPIIPVGITFNNRSLRFNALIDSGADFCIFDAEIGEYLNINIRTGNKEPFGGIQERGIAEAFLHQVTINIGGWDYKTIVGFTYDTAKYGFGILGQKGFFDIFVVQFDLINEVIELKDRK